MKVTIRCLVFNHAPYLRQCLDSLVSQQVNFDYEVLVHDDVSTDGSEKIIAEYAERYPKIIRPLYETQNQYSLHNGSIARIMDKNTTGEYSAFCEGDDYWTDPLKLQKQVDYLDAHPECALVHTSYRFYFQEDNRFVDNDDVRINTKYDKCTPETVLLDYRIKTATVMLRTDLLRKARLSDDFLFKQGHFLMGDTQLWFSLAQLGTIKFMPEVTAVYRKHRNSISKQRDLKKFLRFTLNSYELRYYLAQKNDFTPETNEKFRHLYTIKLMDYLAFKPDFKPMYPLEPVTKQEKWYHFLLKSHLLKGKLKFADWIIREGGPIKRALVKHQ